MADPFITVRQRNNYGNVAVYPVCDDAISFAAIADTKTLTYHALTKISDLGYGIREQGHILNTTPEELYRNN